MKTDSIPMKSAKPTVTRAAAVSQDPVAACEELASQIGDESALTLLFCGDGYDNDRLGEAIRSKMSGPVIGCTTSGIIGPGGYSDTGLSALSLSAEHFDVSTFLIDDLYEYGESIERLRLAVDAIVRNMDDDEHAFGILLVDGLAMIEEHLTAALFHSLPDLPIIGGSAGDHLRFETTQIVHDGVFVSSAATFAVVKTRVPFHVFRHQHHKPSETILVVTGAEPENRRVTTINGYPAAEMYADAIGVTVEELKDSPESFAAHPLLLRAGDRSFIRSLQKVNDDGSIDLFCAIEAGVVLRVGEAEEAISSLSLKLAGVQRDLGRTSALLTFDCVLRRAEFQRANTERIIGEILDEAGAVGFSTYGEQFSALHVNQTLVGVAIGYA